MRDDHPEYPRGEFGIKVIDMVEDLAMFFKYLLCKTLGWQNEHQIALEELRAIRIADFEVEGYEK